MASIEFSKKYADGRVVTITYRDDLAEVCHDKRLTAEAAKKRALKAEKKHQDIKYYEAFHASETKALEAYKEFCATLERDFNPTLFYY